MPKDLRLNVGSVVYAKAVPHILNEAEAHRRFWNLATTVSVEGMVEEVRIKVRNGRKYKWLYTVWSVQGKKKRVELPLGSVSLGPAASPRDPVPERQVEHDYPIEEAVSEDEVMEPTEPGQRSNCSPAPAPALAHIRQEEDGEVQVRTPQTVLVAPQRETVVVHGQEWKTQESPMPVNGTVNRRPWCVRGPDGSMIQEGGSPAFMTPIDYFLWMFPLNHLRTMVDRTNDVLRSKKISETSAGEILKFFGALILMTRFKFSDRREPWEKTTAYKYQPAANFGRFMPFRRFDNLRRFICFSSVPREGIVPSTEDHRWNLCEDFLAAINEHRQERVLPSDLLCVDESISRWYGLGGNWISVGLPHYVAMDRKPEAGCEIQDIACGRGGFVIGLSFVKSAAEMKRIGGYSELNHGTAVLLQLCAPWKGSGRIVCADSYFAPVEAARVLYENGLRFPGVIKNSTKKFPIKYLGDLEMTGRGDHKVLMTRMTVRYNVDFDILAVGWVERNRRYFVSTAGSTLLGRVIERVRCREQDGGARRVKVTVPIPRVPETYYSAASQIDRHNRCRQDDLDMEKTVQVREWSFRVNTTLLSVCVVDAWLLYKGFRGSRNCVHPNEFYAMLAEELIDNTFDSRGLRDRNALPQAKERIKRAPSSGIGEHLTPTKKLRCRANGTSTPYRLQGRCKTCGMKTTFVCSTCRNLSHAELFLCHSATLRACYQAHLGSVHGHE